MSSFSETLRRIRMDKNMTQEQFADLLGRKKQDISRYESGAVSPKISTAADMAKKLGITLCELNGDEPADQTVTAEERQLIRLYRNTIPEIRRSIIQLMELNQATQKERHA